MRGDKPIDSRLERGYRDLIRLAGSRDYGSSDCRFPCLTAWFRLLERVEGLGDSRNGEPVECKDRQSGALNYEFAQAKEFSESASRDLKCSGSDPAPGLEA